MQILFVIIVSMREDKKRLQDLNNTQILFYSFFFVPAESRKSFVERTKPLQYE